MVRLVIVAHSHRETAWRLAACHQVSRCVDPRYTTHRVYDSGGALSAAHGLLRKMSSTEYNINATQEKSQTYRGSRKLTVVVANKLEDVRTQLWHRSCCLPKLTDAHRLLARRNWHERDESANTVSSTRVYRTYK